MRRFNQLNTFPGTNVLNKFDMENVRATRHISSVIVTKSLRRLKITGKVNVK